MRRPRTHVGSVVVRVYMYVGDSLEMRGNSRGIIIIMQLFGIIETIHVKPGHRRLLFHAGWPSMARAK